MEPWESERRRAGSPNKQVSPGGSWRLIPGKDSRNQGRKGALEVSAPTRSQRAGAFAHQLPLPRGLLPGRGAILGLTEPQGISQEAELHPSLLAGPPSIPITTFYSFTPKLLLNLFLHVVQATASAPSTHQSAVERSSHNAWVIRWL